MHFCGGMFALQWFVRKFGYIGNVLLFLSNIPVMHQDFNFQYDQQFSEWMNFEIIDFNLFHSFVNYDIAGVWGTE